MRLPRRIVFPLAAVLGGGVVVLPAAAGSEASPTIDAVNEGIYGHKWSPATATVGENGVVTFNNPTNVNHGVEWVGGPVKPTCSSGVPVGNSASASGTQWSGTCTFAQPGTYTFYCTVHGPEMTGTVTVSATGTTTTTMNMPSGETTSTGSSPSGGSSSSGASSTGSGSVTSGTPAPAAQPQAPATLSPSSGSPIAGSASSAIRLAAIQHGRSVHGSVAVSSAGSGGRLEVRLLAARASLASAARSSALLVGRLVRSSLHSGVVAFAVSLDARAAHALRAHHRLTLSVKILVVTAQGATVTLTRSVLLRS